LREAIGTAGGAAAGLSGPAWSEAVQRGLPDDQGRSLVNALAVEPLPLGSSSPEAYADGILARFQLAAVSREVAALKSKVQRINPIDEPEEHARLFGELLSLEMTARSLRDRLAGAQ
jgi:DNA primase